MLANRPSFRSPKVLHAYNSPEELFGNLPNRSNTHGYLRGPQQDALREYIKFKDKTDIAMELPTGTGKTTVGLLIAEWRRRQYSRPVAYLTLTNQLSGQVLKEGERLGLTCADLRGRRQDRDSAEVGRYLSAQAVGITTYSNLFNVNPVIKNADLIVFDDAHGGEEYISSMWTLRVKKIEFPKIYQEIIATLREALSDAQYRELSGDNLFSGVELVDLTCHPSVYDSLIDVLDPEITPEIHFPWTQIRNKLISCFVFLSQFEIIIRPLVPPTHTHEPFIASTQRIYMSATFSGEADLLRTYGVQDIQVIKTKNPQWGKRYIFSPSLYIDEQKAHELLLSVFTNQKNHRCLLLAPSFQEADRGYSIFEKLSLPPSKLISKDIEHTIVDFTESDNAVLALAGRYDGLDLPGDDCRLLVLWESPNALGLLERHQRECWKLNPLLRRRERTRLIQGMGRCVRDATDYAVVLLFGQSLVDSICNPLLVEILPHEIQHEIDWGRTQSEIGKDDLNIFIEMILGIIDDPSYRKEANESMEDIQQRHMVAEPSTYRYYAQQEVSYSHALWEGNYSRAYQLARKVADGITESDLAGYRAWWLYLAFITAHHGDNLESAFDCLSRAKAIGIYTGFLDNLIRTLTGKKVISSPNDAAFVQAEEIWNQINKLGWHGPKFNKYTDEALTKLKNHSDATQFHMGIELLGNLLGARAIRPTTDGAPDVLWVFSDEYWTFEAKAGKKLKNQICKDDLLQAGAHPDWSVNYDSNLKAQKAIPIIIAPNLGVDNVAMPFAKGVRAISTADIENLASSVFNELTIIRTEFSNKEYASIKENFLSRLKQKNILLDRLLENFTLLSP